MPDNSSGVGSYLDEVLRRLPGFLTAALFDVDRVEVLKGPQGTLYRKDTAGGAIVSCRDSRLDALEGYVDVGYSRWQTSDVTAAVNGPLTTWSRPGSASRLDSGG